MADMRDEYDFSAGVRGAVVPLVPGKTRITIRLDDDIIEWFKHQVEAAGGGNYQTLINAALRDYIGSRRDQLEDSVRRVVREELDRFMPGYAARTVATEHSDGVQPALPFINQPLPATPTAGAMIDAGSGPKPLKEVPGVGGRVVGTKVLESIEFGTKVGPNQ